MAKILSSLAPSTVHLAPLRSGLVFFSTGERTFPRILLHDALFTSSYQDTMTLSLRLPKRLHIGERPHLLSLESTDISTGVALQIIKVLLSRQRVRLLRC